VDGQNRFSVDHVKPKSKYIKLSCDYDNLVYACTRCNTLKSTKLGLPDPCEISLAKHLKLLSSGHFVGLTPQGRRLVEYLMLNSTERINDRSIHLYLFQTQSRVPQNMLRSQFSYPPDLPNLSRLKPPKGNSRPDGLKVSHLVRQQRRHLPVYY
jgi:hypothetical protein